jgi:hypothetical protein
MDNMQQMMQELLARMDANQEKAEVRMTRLEERMNANAKASQEELLGRMDIKQADQEKMATDRKAAG